MAEHYAIAIDIGTSGIRAQSYNLTTHKTISTAITLRHPLPGANVVDHLHFALNIGRETAPNILITTINRVIANLNIDLNKVKEQQKLHPEAPILEVVDGQQRVVTDCLFRYGYISCGKML